MPAAAQDTAPHIHPRADWGARRPRQTAQVLDSGPDHLVVHHTATANTTDYSLAQAYALSRGIQNWHMDNNGWWDTGQHLTISRGGHLMEGRWGTIPALRQGRHVVGAHTANHNSHTLGIENEGTYGSAAPPAALLGSLTVTLAWLCTVYGLNPSQAIVGHRDFNPTACPGDRLYGLLPQLRIDVREHQGDLEDGLERMGYTEVPPELRPSHPQVPAGERIAQFYHGPALGDSDPNRG